jgi:hypothetical protein
LENFLVLSAQLDRSAVASQQNPQVNTRMIGAQAKLAT